MNRLKIQKMTMGVTQPTNNEGREKLSEFHTLPAGRTEFSPKSTRKKLNIIKSEQTFIPSNFFQFHRIFGITFDFFRLLKLIPFYSCSKSFAICASMYVCIGTTLLPMRNYVQKFHVFVVNLWQQRKCLFVIAQQGVSM